MFDKINHFLLENRFIAIFFLIVSILAGLFFSPFTTSGGFFPSDPVAVDAIPNLGENQQIVYTEWAGQSPKDIEDQITYPLTTNLMGLPGVKSIRSSSTIGLSIIYIIFEENVDFYWSRSRILEKLNALPSNLLPPDATPAIGPDATGLGQVFWYTIEGLDDSGKPASGWDLHEIRSVQDFQVKYALNSIKGVSEVASVGGYSLEYQVDIDPLALQSYDIRLDEVVNAVRNANSEVGARTMEINQAEYFVRGLGYVKNLSDLKEAAVKSIDGIPIRIKDVARVSQGPALRRGVLDKNGQEVVGGVITARHGTNPMEVIRRVKEQIEVINQSLPSKTLDNGKKVQLTIVPFYDRSALIVETLFTLESALLLEVLITILVVVLLIRNLRSSLVISSMVPVAILLVFAGMKAFDVDANIVSLSGIAIAIGTMVDLGIILSENIVRHLDTAALGTQKIVDSVRKATSEVSGAILTAVATTVVSFVPVFALEGAEGKLFGPLAWTKTMALIAAALVTLIIMPTLAVIFYRPKKTKAKGIQVFGRVWTRQSIELIVAALGVLILLARFWSPLSFEASNLTNILFTTVVVIIVIGFFALINRYYEDILAFSFDHRRKVILVPALVMLLGLLGWFGSPFQSSENPFIKSFNNTFPGISKEFMPSLDEGSFLLMPTTMAHSGIEYNIDVLQKLDQLAMLVPEVELAVGKLGRVESALDPAPISMFENIIHYKPEFLSDAQGSVGRFETNSDGEFVLSDGRELSNDEALFIDRIEALLIPASNGKPFRNWRSTIRSTDDIWTEISNSTQLTGVTGAPKLQPIETRLIMLQTGMRAPMGIKVYGPDLPTIEAFGLELERILKQTPNVKAAAVFADRVVGKPYLEVEPDRMELQRFGLSVARFNRTLQIALGGAEVSTTVEGRERYPIRVRYPRELRERPEDIERILIDLPDGGKIELGELARISYERGPQNIKSENSFLTSYVLFDKANGVSEMDAVNAGQQAIKKAIDTGELQIPSGVSYAFSGNYENQVRAEKKLSLIIPLVLLVIVFILYLQFRSASTTIIVFTGVAIAFSGGLILLWLTSLDGFMNFHFMGQSMKDIFHLGGHNLSVAVWVGFIALFGIATDDGVLLATHMQQSLSMHKPTERSTIIATVTAAGKRRIRPAVMTSTTTVLALLPILTSTGKGSDIMIPMAIPALGGMMVAVITYFTIPLLYAWVEEKKIEK